MHEEDKRSFEEVCISKEQRYTLAKHINAFNGVLSALIGEGIECGVDVTKEGAIVRTAPIYVSLTEVRNFDPIENTRKIMSVLRTIQDSSLRRRFFAAIKKNNEELLSILQEDPSGKGFFTKEFWQTYREEDEAKKREKENVKFYAEKRENVGEETEKPRESVEGDAVSEETKSHEKRTEQIQKGFPFTAPLIQKRGTLSAFEQIFLRGMAKVIVQTLKLSYIIKSNATPS